MATTKKPKPDKKTMDVAHPETTAPDETSRPIIVSNRTIIQDPMVAPDQTMDSDFREPTTSPVVPTKPEKTIRPLATAKTKETNDSAPPLSASVARQVKSVKPITISEPTEDKIEDEVNPDADSDSRDDSAEEAPADNPASADTPSESTVEDPPKEPTPEPSTTGKPSTAKSKPAPSTDQEEPAETDTPAKSDDESDDEADDKTTDEPDQASKDAAEEAKVLEQEEHLKELIEEKTYFVPIKHASGKGGSLALFLLVLIVAAAAVAYMVTQTSAS